MHGFWLGFYEAGRVLMALTGVAFFAVIAYIGATALSLKTVVMRDVKRLYQPPLNSVKTLAATGKGIAVQEQVRVKHIAGQIKVMAGDVKDTATQIGGAVKTIHTQDLKDAAISARSTISFVSALTKLFLKIPKQTP